MTVKFSQSSKKFEKGSKNYTWEHDYIKNKSKEELIKYVNEGNKPKVRRKVLVELDRRGIKLVWKEKQKDDQE